MKHLIFILSLSFLHSDLAGQNAFDKRASKPKKPDTGISLAGAETLSGKNLPSSAICGAFPASYRLNKQFKDFKTEWDQNGQMALYIQPLGIWKLEGTLQSLGKDKQSASVLQQLNRIAGLLQLKQPETELMPLSVEQDELGYYHYKFQQIFDNLPVYGGALTVHVKENIINGITCHVYPSPELNQKSLIAAGPVIENILRENPYETLSEQAEALLGAKRIVNRLLIYHPENRLNSESYAYHIQYRPNLLDWWEYFVDATTGKILFKINKTCSIDGPRTATASDLNSVNRSINTYLVGSTFYLLDASRPMFNASASLMPNKGVGVIWTLDANNTSGSALFNNTSSNNSWNNKVGVSAHFNAGLAYNYFKNTHGRNSINGSGGNVVSIVNVTDKNGNKLDNAYWNGEMMFYGNGNIGFTPLAGSLDVGGHEMTHGVIQNTANLEYKGQSGAINESMADVFGSLMDRDDWLIGEDITKTSYIPSGALRDMSDPHNGRSSLSQAGFQPKHMNEFYTGTDDNGGVHINSGIANHAYYLIANSATGKDKAEKIYYRALTVYLTSQSQFVDLRRAVIKSAEDLFGNGSNEANTAIQAFNSVGIFGYNGTGGGGSTGNGNGEVILSVNPGTEFILSYNTDPSFSGTFYETNTSGSNFEEKTQTLSKRKASITDNGQLAYFVSEDDDRIKGFSLTGTPGESYVSAVGDAFDNAAISRDGKRLAAVSTLMDSSIYVYDFGLAQWKRFMLYNPTFSEGINAGGVLFADGLEFDYSGQFVVYDAKNLIRGTFGNDITWWDIGIIQVWDHSKNTWGDGSIKKLFNQLPENINIGNPTFAKNTGNIIAFDVIDTEDDTYSIFGKNTVTGKSDEITTNTQIGYPNYSNKDDKLIYDAKSTQGNEVLAIIGLGSDKITASGTPVILITDAKWGTWYAQGTRSLLSSAKDLISFSFPTVSPAPVVNISGTSVTANIHSGVSLNALVPTFVSSQNANVFVNGILQTSGVNAQNFNSPIQYVVKAEDGSTKTYTITVNKISGVEKQQPGAIALYPNPAGRFARLSEPAADYKVHDLHSGLILSGSGTLIDLDTLQSGIYVLRATLHNGTTVCLKLVKE